MYSVVGSDGQVYGPVNQEMLHRWCEEGRIVARTNLIDPISGRVLRAEDLDELRPLLLAEPPVAEAPPIAAPPLPPLAPEEAQVYPASPGNVGPYVPPGPGAGQMQMPAPGAGPYSGQMPYGGTGPVMVSATQVNVHTPPAQGVGGLPPGTIAPQQYAQGTSVQVNSVMAYHPGQPGGAGQQQYPPQQYPPQQQPWGSPQAYGQYGGQQPYGGVSPKTKTVAILLGIFLGPLGVHRFYMGHNGVGIAMLLLSVLSLSILSPLVYLWAIIDVILIAVGTLRDSDGKPLS